jgi:hypothetical protein
MWIIPGKFWAIATVLLILTVAMHDVSMAANTHASQSHSRAVHPRPAGFDHHQPDLAQNSLSGLATLARCDPPPCPDFVDCSAARVSNPIPASNANPEPAAAVKSPIAPTFQAATTISAIDPIPPPSASARRALLQVFLN